MFIPELAFAMENVETRGGLHSDRHYDLVTVAYDRSARVVGVFPGKGEYSALPDDGRAANDPTPSGR